LTAQELFYKISLIENKSKVKRLKFSIVMTTTITTTSIGKGIAKAGWVVLEQTPETALIFKPQVHEGGVRGWLVRFKKERGSDWGEIEEKDFRKLNLFDGACIELGTAQTQKLFEEITKLWGVVQKGVEYGETKYIVGKEEEVVVVSDRNIKETIEQILSKGFTSELWNKLRGIDPATATKLSLLHLHSERSESLRKFQDNIENVLDEKYWQDFFEENKWIFGYGLNYKILRQEQSQPNYGGAKVDGTGGQKGDYLTSTQGDLRFTVLVEIKTPSTPFFRDQHPKEMVPGVYLKTYLMD